MFFYAARIFWIFLTPLTLIALLFAAGLAAYWRSRSAGLLAVTAVLFLIFGLFPVGHNLTVWLEKQYTAPAPISRDIKGIIVLGGIFDTVLTQKTGRVSANDHIERMTAFVELARTHPRARLVFSGGAGQLGPDAADAREAEDAKAYLAAIGYGALPVEYESASRNTYENARNTMTMIRPAQDEKWIVVTSAYHMPRAVGTFKALGWHVIPHVADMKTDGAYRLMPSLNVARNFALLDLSIKELIGTLVYYITGKSAVALPVRTDLVFGRIDMGKITIE